MPFETKTLDSFAGINEDESPDQLADNELVLAENCCRYGSAFGTRPGCALELAGTGNYSAQLAGAAAVQGLVEFSLAFTAGIRAASTQLSAVLFVISNGNCFTDSATSLTKGAGVTISTTGATPNLWTFAEHKNVLYMAGGQDGDTVNQWTGTGNVNQVTFNNAAGTPIDAKYIFEKWNYGFLAGMNGSGADDNPMVVRYSALGDMTNWPAGNTVGGTSTIGGFDAFGDNWITGFSEYSDNHGDWLMVLSRRALYGVQQQEIPQAPFRVGNEGIVANGCVSQRAYISLGQDSGDAVYVSENGIHSLRQSQAFGGREDKFLSWKIRQLFADVTKSAIQNSCGAYWYEEGIVILALPYLGSASDTLVLALDVRGEDALTSENARWYHWILSGIVISSIASVRDTSGNRKIYFGTSDGYVMRFTRSSYADRGSAYAVRWITKHNAYGRGDRQKCFGDIYPSARPGGDYKPSLTLFYDRGLRISDVYDIDMPTSPALWDSTTWDTGVWSEDDELSTEKQFGLGCGYTLAMGFSHSGGEEPFFITKVDYEVCLEGESGGDI